MCRRRITSKFRLTLTSYAADIHDLLSRSLIRNPIRLERFDVEFLFRLNSSRRAPAPSLLVLAYSRRLGATRGGKSLILMYVCIATDVDQVESNVQWMNPILSTGERDQRYLSSSEHYREIYTGRTGERPRSSPMSDFPNSMLDRRLERTLPVTTGIHRDSNPRRQGRPKVWQDRACSNASTGSVYRI